MTTITAYLRTACRHRMPAFLLATLCLFAHVPDSHANTREDPTVLKGLVERFVAANLRAPAGEELVLQEVSIDTNVNVAPCRVPVSAMFAQSQGTPNTVILQCSDAAGWTLYVPVRIEALANVVATTRRLMPGDLISEHDLVIEKRPVSGLFDGYYRDMEALASMSAARMLPAGSVLTPKNVRRVAMVHRNQAIALVLKKGPIAVTMTGIAKTDGFLHETIKVMNPSSRKVVDAVVTGYNSAEIT